jgi:hypothetical protein
MNYQSCWDVFGVRLKHLFGDVQTNKLLAVHGADDLSGAHSCITIHEESSVVFVKTLDYHTLGTLMPYPSDDSPRVSIFLFKRLFHFGAPIDSPVRREASTASIRGGTSHAC